MVTIGRYDALFPPDEAVLLLRGCAQPTAQNKPDRCGRHGAKRDRRRLPAGLATVIICSTGGLRGARRPARLLPILKPRLIPSRCACGRSGKVRGRSRYVGRALHVDYQVHPADGDGAEAGVRKGLLHHLGGAGSVPSLHVLVGCHITTEARPRWPCPGCHRGRPSAPPSTPSRRPSSTSSPASSTS